MGLLVGNTTVIEHAGTYVQYSRTVSRNYQSKKVDIGFVLPKGIALTDGFDLAKAIVHRQLGIRLRGDVDRMDSLCWTVFNQSLFDFKKR